MKRNQKTVKFVALLCLAAVLLGTLASCGGAANAHGTWGALSWSYSKSTKTLTITGSDAMDDFPDADSVEWKSIRESVTNVVIEEGVTSVGDYAFYYMPALTTVQLPTTVTELGDFSFAFCSALTTVSIPEQVNTIGNGAFEGCAALSSLYLPPSVTKLGDFAFAFCHSLQNMMITAPTVQVGSRAFRNCRSLRQLTFRSTVTESMVAKDAFEGASITFDNITTTDQLLGSTTVTIRYLLNDEELEVYEETFGYGVSYSVNSPAIEGYTPSLETISGTADGTDREETVTYTEAPPSEAPKPSISSASIIGLVIMVVALLGIGVAVFLLIRSDKSSKESKDKQTK